MSATQALAEWLIALGSNVQAEGRLEQALAALAALGQVRETSARVDSVDAAARGPAYRNQLLRLRASADEATLRRALKDIERAAGRDPARIAAGLCDLDLDLLARRQGEGWRLLDGKALRVPAVRALWDALTATT